MTNSEQNYFSEYSRFLDSSGIHLTYSAVSSYLNAEDRMSIKERSFLKEHLDTCRECGEKEEEIREIEGITDQKNQANILHVLPMFIRHSAAAILLVGIGISMYVLLDERGPEQTVHQMQKIDPSVAESTPDPSRFIPNGTLENFIGRTFRSSGKIVGFTPAAGDTVANPVQMQWKGEDLSPTTTVSVVDNENRERWRKSTAVKRITIDTILPPGLYYVKLEPNGKLIFVSKFIIER